jgi:antitoxin HicB
MDFVATSTVSRSRYLNRPYRIVLTREGRGTGAGWIASVEELPGCEARGMTVDEAALAAREAMEVWISDALENGRSIPAPRSPASKDRGPLELDIPPSLHVALTRGAVREGMELRAFVTTALAAAVGWRPAEDEPHGTWLAARAGRFGSSSGGMSERMTRFVQIGSVALVALCVLAALALLYVAITNA